MTDQANIPSGKRLPEHEADYIERSDNPNVQIHMVSPTVEGYFRLPAIWIESAPTDIEQAKLDPLVHHVPVVRSILKSGIEAKALRNGMFLFNFRDWVGGPTVLVPGYTYPEPRTPHIAPKEHQEARRRAEEIAIIRAQVLNAHQACLTTAERLVMHRSAGMGFPVTAWSAYKSIRMDTPIHYREDTEDLNSFAQNAMDNFYRHTRRRPLGRRVLERVVVEKSFQLLDTILLHPNPIALPLVASMFQAASRSRDKHFGEAVTLSWTVCEQLVSHAWKHHLAMLQTIAGTQRITKDRREKLLGRDFTASIMVESLELAGVIDHDLYRRLEIVRKARNKWAHDMRVPKESEVWVSFDAARDLMSHLLGIRIELQAGGRGGVPMWGLSYMTKDEQDKLLAK